ncbi:MAG: sigma-70 family RNA polymerase sigma factor [Lachnospira sp.]|nr:sigma-70 family RNA polymerase sigma factor [Lachnospira sp.]
MNNNLRKEDIEALITRNKNSICKLAYCYVKNTDDVQDIYQSVFEKYLKYTPSFESEEHEKAWFIRTTINTCKNVCSSAWHKKVFAFQHDDLQQQIEAHQSLCTTESNPMTEKLLSSIMKLPDKYRVVIHLYYYEDYPTKEIARLIGSSVATVKTRLCRARDMLEQSLKSE